MNSRSRNQNQRVLLSTLPVELKPWLYASGSLTQQLTDLAQGQFHVEPIQEHFQRLGFANAKWMQMSHQHTSWVRESYLYGSEQSPWVKAKSIFPILSLQKKPEFFSILAPNRLACFCFSAPIHSASVGWYF